MSNGNWYSKASSSTQKSNEERDFLLKTIEEQKDQLNRIQSKFKDVTHSYKSLLAEKQALEITLKALKGKSLKNALAPSSTPQSTAVSDASASESEASNKFVSPESSSISSTVAKEQEDKINALTSNIQLILDNKSKMESAYMAEKKKIRNELDESKNKLENYKLEVEKKYESYELKLKELRVSLKQSQQDREKLTQDLNTMIKSKSAELDNKISSMNEETQTLLISLRNENNDLKLKLKNLNKQFDNKCEEVTQCCTDYKKLKAIHEQQLKEDESQLTELRNQLKELNKSSEIRISELEANISQLCFTIANYESNNNINSHSSTRNIKKNLEENILDLKLKANQLNEKSLDFDTAIEQISHLKSYIEKSAKDLNINFNFNEIWLQNGNLSLQQEQQKQKELRNEIDKLKEENSHLINEYEKYKIRTNYLIKSAKQTSKELSANQDLENQNQIQIKKLKDELDLYKKRVLVVEKEKNDELKRQSDNTEILLNTMRIDFKQQLDKTEQDRLKSINDVEKELMKQRERTLKLLAEKDTELNRLKSGFMMKKSPSRQTIDENTTNNHDNSLEAKGSGNTSDLVDNEDENEDLNEKLSHSNLIMNSPNGEIEPNRLLYYNEQNAYKEIELSKLRLLKTDLEYKLKQNNDEHSVDIDRFQNQILVLKQEIERLKLNHSRDEMNGANLEYIKNVVFNFMTTKDNNVKLSMINAITQILQFTKNEKQRLQSISNKLV